MATDQLAVLHHESNPLQLANVGDRISSNGDEIGKLPWLHGADPVLPAPGDSTRGDYLAAYALPR